MDFTDFTVVIRGYDTAEVDDLVRRIEEARASESPEPPGRGR